MLKVQCSVQFKETVWHATEYPYRLHLRGKQNYEQANEKSRRTPEAGHKFSTMKIKVYFFHDVILFHVPRCLAQSASSPRYCPLLLQCYAQLKRLYA